MSELQHPIELTVSADRAAVLIDHLMRVGQPVMLWGAPGVAKSALSVQACARAGRKVVDFRTNLRDTVDFRGIPVAHHDTKTTEWYTPAELPQIARDGKNPCLLLEEINTAPAQVQAVCFQLVWERRVGDYKLPEDCAIIATGNRVGDRAAAQRMPTALRNRFAHITIAVTSRRGKNGRWRMAFPQSCGRSFGSGRSCCISCRAVTKMRSRRRVASRCAPRS